MSSENIQHLIAMVVYMLFVVGIGVYFAKRANKNASSYFLGGRTLGPWVAAFSAEASDMSGWLLMACRDLRIGQVSQVQDGQQLVCLSVHTLTG